MKNGSTGSPPERERAREREEGTEKYPDNPQEERKEAAATEGTNKVVLPDLERPLNGLRGPLVPIGYSASPARYRPFWEFNNRYW